MNPSHRHPSRLEVDVVCLGGGVAGEANAVGLHGSGPTLVVVERVLAASRVAMECGFVGRA